MPDPEQFSLLTVKGLAQKTPDRLTCLVLDQAIFTQIKGHLEKMISEDRIWHLIAVGDRSSDIEDELDDLIVSSTPHLVMTSSVESYDFDEIFSLATMMPEGSEQPRKIAYVYDDAQPELREIAERFAREATALPG